MDGPTDQDVAQTVGNAERIELWRGRLGDVSWFMRCLNEWLARKANAEDKCTGRFWEGRFRCQLLEDEGAVLACMAYVDLNPLRAKMATCLEESRLTSVHDRICAKRARLRLEASRKGLCPTRSGGRGSRKDSAPRDFVKGKGDMEPTAEQARLLEEASEEADKDRWLCRFSDELPLGVNTVLAMKFEDYVELLEWTGRCVVEGKQGSISGAALPVLERMELEVENWVETVERYGSIYHRVAGKVENLKRKAVKLGQRWISGQGKSRWVFRRKGRAPVVAV